MQALCTLTLKMCRKMQNVSGAVKADGEVVYEVLVMEVKSWSNYPVLAVEDTVD